MMDCGLSTSSPLYVSKLQTSKADPKRNVISSCATRNGRRSRGLVGVGNSQNLAWGLGQGGILRRRVVVKCEADADGGVKEGFENVGSGGGGNSAAIEVEDRIADGTQISGKILYISF